MNKTTNYKLQANQNELNLFTKLNIMKKILFLIMMVSSVYINAQDFTVRGVVSDESDVLPGVSIVVAGTNQGTITDVNGKYSINVKKGSKLIFSYIGYRAHEAVANQSTINVKMKTDAIQLEEAVVVGYATQKKATLTGAVSSVSSENLTKRNVASLSTALQGAMPGVTIQQTSGQPGSDGGQIRVRGIGSIKSDQDPLVLVDGIEMDINQVDANTVASVSVLKDAASASIYGSRASNGVILITTKRGKAGKVTTTYSGYLTVQRPTNMPEPVAAWEYLQAELNSWDNAGASVTNTQREQQLRWIEEQRTLKPDNWTRYDTDWKKETLKDNSLMHSHNVTVSGGSEDISFFASGSYLSQDGLIPNDNFDRTNLRLNADAKILSWMKLGIETNLRQSNLLNPGISTPKAIINQALYMLPHISAAKELDGNWGYGKNGINPTAAANASGEKKVRTSEALVNGTLTFTPIKGLELIGQYSRRQVSKRTRTLITPYLTSLSGMVKAEYPDHDSLKEEWEQTVRNYYRAQASYERTMNDHYAKLLVGFQAEDSEFTSFYGAKQGFDLERYYLDNGDGSTASSGGGANSWAMMSWYGRLNYNYQQRYLLEVNGRYDGSSRFTKNNRWGFFPSVSAGWVVSQENFLKNTTDIIDILKLRVSYGLLGNQNIGNYPYAAVVKPGYGYYLGDDKSLAPGVAQTTLSNSDISWEKSKQFDVGIDLSLWNGLLSITADYYIKNIYDMLLTFPLPYYAGMQPAYSNAGDMSNKGWEISIGHKNKIKDFNYGVTFTLSDNRNKITNLNGLNSQDKTMVEGYPNNGIWGYLSDGYYQDWDDVANSPKLSNSARPGYVKYKKINQGEGIDPMLIDSRDQVYLGDSFPHFEYGLNLNASWKNFDLTIFFQGVGQRSTFMSGIGLKPFANGANLFRHQMDSWTEDNRNAEYPILVPEANAADNYVRSDKWVRNAAYCRLKNMVLGYTLPQSLTKKLNIGSLRLYVSGQNLFTISNFYKGYDPEVSYGGNQGGEFYPIMQTFTVGVDLKF
ncbi:TonB-dependent receptor [Bacteroides xylanisolvens]|uniref:SusC/RagA family TonB-linked outer membrane protein n=1 Tax=Bacteroides xylanisolvens TaxID=371601 RepID=UPI002307F803|nr:TonB-dependent receptor [Bacteroides xylanisolvens]MDB0719197.1 TonB-dependent receptor [Bacteroides xylanisolvens]MDB0739365.1 TonB-dependent receptor [Bacteroides xylanisolvens]